MRYQIEIRDAAKIAFPIPHLKGRLTHKNVGGNHFASFSECVNWLENKRENLAPGKYVAIATGAGMIYGIWLFTIEEREHVQVERVVTGGI